MRSYFGITVHFISNQKLHNAMLAYTQFKCHYTADKSVTEFEELVSNFEITNKRIISVAG